MNGKVDETVLVTKSVKWNIPVTVDLKPAESYGSNEFWARRSDVSVTWQNNK